MIWVRDDMEDESDKDTRIRELEQDNKRLRDELDFIKNMNGHRRKLRMKG